MKNLFCLHPFFHMDLSGTIGDVYCCCQGWAKEACGNMRNRSLLEIWNGPGYQKMREHMLKGQWEEVCNPVCPTVTQWRALNRPIAPETLKRLDYITPLLASEILAGKTVLEATPTTVILANSGLCNHQCIMCGWNGAVDDPAVLNKAHRELVELLPNMRELVLCGGGEPFVRPDTLAILLGPRFEGLKIRLITNGVLLPRYWERIKHHDFGIINVSVDAATKATYERIHRKSKWENLIAALDLLRPNMHKFERVIVSMTVMKENYREVPAFLQLAKSYGFRAQLGKVRQLGDLPPSSNFFDNDKETLADFVRVMQRLEPGAMDNVAPTNLIEFLPQNKQAQAPQRH